MTLVAENNRLLIFDYACRPVQEIMVNDTALFAISPDKDKIVVLSVDSDSSSGDGLVVHEGGKLTVYSWKTEESDSKVIEMSRFQR
jgi:hypothetical protein